MAGKATKKTASVDTKVEAVRRFFADSKPENHPIKEHPVTKQEEYVRDLYLEMLCVMAQYESSNTENAFTLIKRIMAACGETQPLQEYIKRSMELTPERAAEFVKQCKDNGLREIFMVDSMLLFCANGEPNVKQVEFITEFGDMLEFDREQIEDMSRFALAILTQDSDGYQKLLRDENAIVQESLVGYAKEFMCGIIINTSRKMHYYSQKATRFTLDDDTICHNILVAAAELEGLTPSEAERRVDAYHRLEGFVEEHGLFLWEDLDELIFENFIFDSFPFYFSSIGNLHFYDCSFKNWTSRESEYDDFCGYITICDYERFILERCSFTNFNNGEYPIIYSGLQKSDHFVEITSCGFTNCSSHWPSGAVILVSGWENYCAGNRLLVTKSKFIDCKQNLGNSLGKLFDGCCYPEEHNNIFTRSGGFDVALPF